MRITKPSIELIRPEWDAPANVEAFFTTRNGGVSSGAYGGADGFNGLNLGDHVGDYGFAVKANRSMLGEFVPGEPKWLKQIHSTKVLPADEISVGTEADGSVTTNPNEVCVVMTADCVPILLCDKEGRGVAAIHAGWRGLADGVIQEGVRQLKGKLPENAEILAWIGPCIRKEAFEVGPEVVKIFREGALKNVADIAIEPFGEKWRIDMPTFCIEALRLSGVDQVTDSGLCTASDPNRFYSYRRDGGTGRHAAVIFKRS